MLVVFRLRLLTGVRGYVRPSCRASAPCRLRRRWLPRVVRRNAVLALLACVPPAALVRVLRARRRRVPTGLRRRVCASRWSPAPRRLIRRHLRRSPAVTACTASAAIALGGVRFGLLRGRLLAGVRCCARPSCRVSAPRSQGWRRLPLAVGGKRRPRVPRVRASRRSSSRPPRPLSPRSRRVSSPRLRVALSARAAPSAPAPPAPLRFRDRLSRVCRFRSRWSSVRPLPRPLPPCPRFFAPSRLTVAPLVRVAWPVPLPPAPSLRHGSAPRARRVGVFASLVSLRRVHAGRLPPSCLPSRVAQPRALPLRKPPPSLGDS